MTYYEIQGRQLFGNRAQNRQIVLCPNAAAFDVV